MLATEAVLIGMFLDEIAPRILEYDVWFICLRLEWLGSLVVNKNLGITLLGIAVSCMTFKMGRIPSYHCLMEELQVPSFSWIGG